MKASPLAETIIFVVVVVQFFAHIIHIDIYMCVCEIWQVYLKRDVLHKMHQNHLVCARACMWGRHCGYWQTLFFTFQTVARHEVTSLLAKFQVVTLCSSHNPAAFNTFPCPHAMCTIMNCTCYAILKSYQLVLMAYQFGCVAELP